MCSRTKIDTLLRVSDHMSHDMCEIDCEIDCFVKLSLQFVYKLFTFKKCFAQKLNFSEKVPLGNPPIGDYPQGDTPLGLFLLLGKARSALL